MKTTQTLLALCMLLALAATSWAGDDHDDDGGSSKICRKTAKLQRQSAAYELKEELKVHMAVCLNLTDKDERIECLIETFDAYSEGKQLADDQYEARLELCDLLGGGAYDPDIDPGDFPTSTRIDNPYLPFPVGAQWLFHSETEDGFEVITLEVMSQTRNILGIPCVSVRDIVTIDGQAVEDTIDWYAQDEDGNVWYFGEISFSFSEDGFVESIEGSWLAGEDGAKPGIVMLADPTVGTTYRQEWLLGDAEDAATVLDDDATVEIDGLGSFEHCVQTADFLPPDPDALEHKFYAPGIGFILETKPGSTEVLELVSYSGL